MPRNIYHFDIAIKRQLKGLTKLDNYHGLLAVLEDYCVIAGAIAILWLSPFCYPISILVIGARQRALATLLHESAHKTLCRNRQLNYLLGTWFSGYLIFQLYKPYIQSHVLHHHKYLGQPGKDPDLQFHQKEGLYRTMSPGQFKWKFLIKPWLCLSSYRHLKYLLNTRFRPSNISELPDYKSELMQFVALWAAIFITILVLDIWLEFLLLWIVPYLTTFQVINWYCELSEHFPIPDPGVLDIHLTRNRFSPPIEKFFFGIHEENYHLEHHLHPGVPYWNLAEANSIRRQDKSYDTLNATMGGLFLRGKNRSPSVISTILNRSHDTVSPATATSVSTVQNVPN